MASDYITTLEAVGDMMKTNGTPFFRLYQKVGWNDYAPLADNLKQTEVNAETGFSFLKRMVEHYPAGKAFAVKLQPAASSNGEKVTGYIDFKMDAPVVTSPTVQGLGGLGGDGLTDNLLGHIQKMNEVTLATMEPRIKLAQKEIQLEYREKELDRRERELKEWEKELKEREEDRTKPLVNGFGKAFEKFFGSSPENNTSLAGAETKIESAPATQKELIIEDIANKVNDSSLDITEIAVIGEVVEKIINKPTASGDIHHYLKTI
jgi:hypothetical protein